MMAQTVIEISGNISSSTTWTSNNVYLLKTTNCVFVTNNATLTIEPGTLIKGETQSALLITRGAKIIAEGTPERPIVFTSAMPAGQRTLGDWGGLLLAGNAPVNVPGGAAFFPFGGKAEARAREVLVGAHDRAPEVASEIKFGGKLLRRGEVTAGHI